MPTSPETPFQGLLSSVGSKQSDAAERIQVSCFAPRTDEEAAAFQRQSRLSQIWHECLGTIVVWDTKTGTPKGVTFGLIISREQLFGPSPFIYICNISCVFACREMKMEGCHRHITYVGIYGNVRLECPSTRLSNTIPCAWRPAGAGTFSAAESCGAPHF